MLSAVKTATLFLTFFGSAIAVPTTCHHKATAKRYDDGWWSKVWGWPSQPTPFPAPPVITGFPKPFTPPPPPPFPSTGGPSNSIAAKYLAAHNNVRLGHAAQPLAWSNTLAAMAQKWANNCQTVHSGGSLGPYGENLAWGSPGFNQTGAVGFWAAEASQYNPRKPKMSHFTQMVWKGTQQVGCASATCPKLINNNVGVLHVCEYNPPGNYVGEYSQNVAV